MVIKAHTDTQSHDVTSLPRRHVYMSCLTLSPPPPFTFFMLELFEL